VELARLAGGAVAVEGGDLHRLGAALDDLRGEAVGQGDHLAVAEAGGLAVAGGEGREVGLEHEVGGLLRPQHAVAVAVEHVGLAALGLLAEDLAGARVDEREGRAHRRAVDREHAGVEQRAEVTSSVKRVSWRDLPGLARCRRGGWRSRRRWR
jgi:hypothetical protein